MKNSNWIFARKSILFRASYSYLVQIFVSFIFSGDVTRELSPVIWIRISGFVYCDGGNLYLRFEYDLGPSKERQYLDSKGDPFFVGNDPRCSLWRYGFTMDAICRANAITFERLHSFRMVFLLWYREGRFATGRADRERKLFRALHFFCLHQTC